MNNTFFVAALSFLLLSACSGSSSENDEKGGENHKNLSGEIRIDGSSTVFPLSEAVSEEFINKYPDVNISVGESGTGGGFKKLSRMEIDICDASRAITPEEQEACKRSGVEFIEIPIALDGLVVVVNENNTWVDKLSLEELRKLWHSSSQGKIKTWRQINPAFPDEQIKLYGPGTASGTYDYFTEAVCGKRGDSRGDYTASENDNLLVQGIANDRNAIGYFGLAYYEQNKDKLKLVAIDAGNGGVKPNINTVSEGTYKPLSRPEFIYVNAKSSARVEVEQFVKFYIKNAAWLSKEVGYVPLSDDLYNIAMERFINRKTGTIFTKGRTVVNTSLAEAMK